MKRFIAVIFFVLFVIVLPAESNEDISHEIASVFKDWSLTVGGGILYQPEYQGSRDMEVIFLPVFTPIYKNFLYVSPMGGGVYFPIYKNKIIGKAGLGYDLFKISGERVLMGLSDREDGIILDGEVRFNFHKNYTAAIIARKVFWGSDSLHVEGRLGARYAVTDKLTISFGAHATFGDSKYMRFKFGITREQSAISGFEEYEPGAAFKSVGGEIAFRYALSKEITLAAVHSETMLLKQALKSPTTFRQRQPRTFLTITYSFR